MLKDDSDGLTVRELRLLLEKLERDGYGGWLVEADGLSTTNVLATALDERYSRVVLRCWHAIRQF